jgi:hypothetical protein
MQSHARKRIGIYEKNAQWKNLMHRSWRSKHSFDALVRTKGGTLGGYGSADTLAPCPETATMRQMIKALGDMKEGSLGGIAFVQRMRSHPSYRAMMIIIEIVQLLRDLFNELQAHPTAILPGWVISKSGWLFVDDRLMNAASALLDAKEMKK